MVTRCRTISLIKSIDTTSVTLMDWRESGRTMLHAGETPHSSSLLSLVRGKGLNPDAASSCNTIIRDNRPGPGDAHGCPYRDFPTEKLRATLNDFYGIGFRSDDMEEIIRAAEGQHYHVACTRVFEITHGERGLTDGDSVTHPNQYAARSKELECEKEEESRARPHGTDEAAPMAVDG